MLLPSVENNVTSNLARQKPNVATDLSPASTTQLAEPNQQTHQKQQHATVEEVADKSAKQSSQKESLDKIEDKHFSVSAENAYPDFTLELSHTDNPPVSSTPPELKPDEVRYGRKRPPLPISFSFGLRRPQAVAVAMRHPLIGSQAPSTGAQAILDTFDLAATNRLPYVKGSGLSLAA